MKVLNVTATILVSFVSLVAQLQAQTSSSTVGAASSEVRAVSKSASREKAMHPTELADRYFASVRDRDIERFMALFRKDATFVLPDGREIVGESAIREMEMAVFKSGVPSPVPAAMVVGEHSIAVEVQVHLSGGGIRRVASFFHLGDDGRIQRLSVYRQGG